MSIAGSPQILPGRGGIQSIVKTGTSGLVDTYTINYTDGSTSTFDITNGADGQDGANGTNGTNGADGVGISHIQKTSTSGLTDTYTITYTDESTSTFTVVNGADGQDGNDGKDGKDGDDGKDGANGISISTIEKTSTSGNVDTYTITKSDNTTATFTVTNGTSIDKIELTSSDHNVDTYTITLTDGSTSTFKVTNGTSIQDIEKTSTTANVDTYTVSLTDGTSYTYDVTNGTSIKSIAKTSTSGYVDTYTITLTDNSTTTFTVTNGRDGSSPSISDTGWINLTLGSGVTVRNMHPRYRVVAGRIAIYEYDVTATVSANASLTIATGVPSYYLPTYNGNNYTVYAAGMCQGTRLDRALISSSGSLGLDWSVTIKDGSANTTNTWHQGHLIVFL